MDILDQAHRLAANGEQQAAVELVMRGAEAGDALAQFAVANWRLYGLNGARDFDDAHRLLDLAIASGNIEAVHLKANLVANGTGTDANFESALQQLESIKGRDSLATLQLRLLDPQLSIHPVREQLSTDPDIRVFHGLLSPEKCEYLMFRAQSELRPSSVVNPASGRRMPHPARTSFGMSFDPATEDPVVRMINLQLAELTQTEIECGEPLHILRYTPGQQYRPHFDAIPGADNQRTWTVIIYLNDGYEGGQTELDLLGLSFRGAAGDALAFRNADDAGNPDGRLRHAGMPVTTGVKWIASRWIRAGRHDPWTVAY